MIYNNEADLKQKSKENLSKYWGKAVAVTAIYFVVSAILASIFKNIETNRTTIIENLLLVFLNLGMIAFYFNVLKQTAEIKDIFSQSKLFFKGLIITLIQTGPGILLIIIGLFIPEKTTDSDILAFYGLATLILAIASIILALMFALSTTILVENPDTSIANALKESNRLMMGNKWKLILLYLSFIGWFLLSILTLGIGFLFLIPYVQMTVINFYLDLKAKKE